MNSTAFVSATPVLARSTGPLATSSFTSRCTPVTVPVRRQAVVTMVGPEIRKRPEIQKVPQGFTKFSEQLNGRAAMLGFMLGVVTELITGRGILGQVGSIFEIVNLASALGN